MKNIRQRKTDPSPSSRGSSLYPQDEMMSIVIEPDDTSAIMDKRGNDHAASLPADYHDDDHMQFPYHYIPQPSRMITDKRYKDFIEGRVSKRKQESMFPTGPECAGHCIAFSWIAVMFLIWVGMMIDTQPIFIKGVKPKGSDAIEGVTFKVRTVDQLLPACTTAFQTAYAYLATILICYAYRRNCFHILASKLCIIRRRRDYKDIPDHPNHPLHMVGDTKDTMIGLPLYHPTTAYANTNTSRSCCRCLSTTWNRCFIVLRNLWQRWCCRIGLASIMRRNSNTKRRRE